MKKDSERIMQAAVKKDMRNLATGSRRSEYSGGYRLVLPWPPSVNRLWRHVMVGKSMRTIVSREGREYKTAVRLACLEQGAPIGLKHKVAVRIKLQPPDNRRRDIDNPCKALLDSLTASGVWEDDSLIDDLHVYRGDVVPGGKVTIEIWRQK